MARGTTTDPAASIRPAKLFTASLKPRPAAVISVLAASVSWAMLIAACAAHDGVLRLPGFGRGLLDHYGFQACFLAGPLVLLTAHYAIAYFLRLLRDIDQFTAPDADAAVLATIIRPHIDSILLRGRWRLMLLLLCFIGVAASFAIFGKLDRPQDFWGNDVFNAQAYRWSYLAANGYLLILWGAIYPIGLFYAVHISISAEVIVANFMRMNVLRLNFLHIDKCGGMARFGTLNLIIMLIYVWSFAAIWALHITHRYDYLSLLAGALAVSAAFILQSTFGIYWVAKAISTQRNDLVTSLNERIRRMMEGKRHSFTAAVATMEYRDRVLAVTAFPYSKSVSLAVNFLRFAPAALGVAKLIMPRL